MVIRSIDEIIAYVRDLSATLESHKHLKGDNLNSFPLRDDQFIYSYNYSTNKMSYARGFDRVLGIKDDEVDMRKFLERIHPDDLEMVIRVSAAGIAYGRRVSALPPFNMALNISFRVRMLSGEIKKIFRQSSGLDVDEDGHMLTSLSVCTDIYQHSMTDEVTFRFTGPEPEVMEELLIEQLEGGKASKLSNRELEVIKYLAKGLSSKEIAVQLNISSHTVDTHRRNMLRKTGSLNTAQLVINAGKTQL